MNLPTIIALAAIGSAAVVWGVTCFIMWDWNPSNWSEAVRFLAVLAWAISTPRAVLLVGRNKA